MIIGDRFRPIFRLIRIVNNLEKKYAHAPARHFETNQLRHKFSRARCAITRAHTQRSNHIEMGHTNYMHLFVWRWLALRADGNHSVGSDKAWLGLALGAHNRKPRSFSSINQTNVLLNIYYIYLYSSQCGPITHTKQRPTTETPPEQSKWTNHQITPRL